MIRNNFFKISIVLIILIALGLGLYRSYTEYRNDLSEVQKKLPSYYQSYGYDYYDIVPKNKADFDNMLKWTQLTSSASDLNFLDYGYNILYDSIEKSAIVYSFGKDKVDNNLKSHRNILDSLGRFKANSQSFFDYAGSTFSEKDIPLLKVSELDFPCELAIKESEKNPYYSFQLYKEEKNLLPNNKSEFLKLLADLQRNYLSIISEDRLTDNLIFVKYRKGSVEVICENNLNQKQITLLKKEMESYFSSNINKVFFDYALFSINFTTTNNHLN